MSSISTTALVDGGKAIALSVLFGMILAFVPVLAILAVPLIPIPVAYISSRHGIVLGVLASLAIGSLCLVLSDPVSGLLAFMLVALVGVGGGLALRRGWREPGLLMTLAVLFLVAQLSWAAVIIVNSGMSPVDAVNSVTDQVLEIGQQTPSLFGGEQGLSQVRDTLAMLPYLLPAFLLVASLAFAAGMIYVARPVFDRLGQAFPRGFSFRELRMHFSLAYAMIAGLICYILAPYVADSYSSAVYLVGLNLLIVSQALFFVQALAITHFFLDRFKVSRPKRVGVYVVLVVLQVTLSLPSWMGLFDIWIDYRRRFAGKMRPSQ